MSFRKLSHLRVYRNILKRIIFNPIKTISPEIGSKGDLKQVENLLSHDESKALWIKINQTLQIIH
jgi:hypothetical protein